MPAGFQWQCQRAQGRVRGHVKTDCPLTEEVFIIYRQHEIKRLLRKANNLLEVTFSSYFNPSFDFSSHLIKAQSNCPQQNHHYITKMKFPPQTEDPGAQVPKTCDTLRECEGSGLPVWIQERNCLYKQIKTITDPSPAKKGETARAQKSCMGGCFERSTM